MAETTTTTTKKDLIKIIIKPYSREMLSRAMLNHKKKKKFSSKLREKRSYGSPRALQTQQPENGTQYIRVQFAKIRTHAKVHGNKAQKKKNCDDFSLISHNTKNNMTYKGRWRVPSSENITRV